MRGKDFKEKYFPEMNNQIEIVTWGSDEDHQMTERKRERERGGGEGREKEVDNGAEFV